VARIEVPLDELDRLVAPGVREHVVEGLRELGFLHVALDLAGLRSGSLNAALGPGQKKGTARGGQRV
jgi:uncharacterized protein